MKVKELLEKLNDFNPDQDIICYCEDEGVVTTDQGFKLFEIVNVDLKEAEKTRIKGIVPSLIFGKTEHSTANVLMEITSDF